MTLDHLKSELRLRNISLNVENEKLILLDPHRRISPHLDEAVQHYRDALIEGLKPISSVTGPLSSPKSLNGEPCDALNAMTMDGLAASNMAITAYSPAFDDVIGLAGNDVRVTVEGIAIYRAQDLMILQDCEDLKIVNKVKRFLDGEVVLPDEEAHKIPAETFLQTETESRCWCCGSSEFWDNGGELVCVRCHPRPRINPTAERLREAVHAAPSWTELQSLVSAVDNAFEQTAITQRQAEDLAVIIAERSRHIPSNVDDTVRRSSKTGGPTKSEYVEE